ncbi:uncharacterized protein LOC116182634 [Photinus pyralis]|uniref:uncharacterized protein LOC116182634 n=1 Tax=Photinus pyralis TaxID=7054 RepID=UPI0012671647|nr:uncharacterized protein LOC116182634 [Photinus pyralis]
MDRATKSRSAVRRAFTTIANKLNEMIEAESPDINNIRANLELFHDKAESLRHANQEIYDLMLDADATEDQLDTEIACVDRSTAEELEYPVKRREKIIHTLFGGTSTDEQDHACYDVRVLDLDQRYAFRFEVLEQSIICDNIIPVFNGPWMNELDRLQIKISDVTIATPVEILIGADVAGKLLTGKKYVLDCGPVAVETYLGWTLLGKVPVLNKQKSITAMSVTSMLCKDVTITNLWNLDIIGIDDPVDKQSKEEINLAVNEYFLETVQIDEDGRYVVQMPWKQGHPPLRKNIDIAKKRIESIAKKLQRDGLFDDYGDVLKEWEQIGIIEEVTERNAINNENVFYLLHRPIIKASSTTTKIRPYSHSDIERSGFDMVNDHSRNADSDFVEVRGFSKPQTLS